MPLKPVLGVRGAVAGHRLGALEGGGGLPPPLQCVPARGSTSGHMNSHRAREVAAAARSRVLEGRTGRREEGVRHGILSPPPPISITPSPADLLVCRRGHEYDICCRGM